MSWLKYKSKYEGEFAESNPFNALKKQRQKLAEKTGEAEIDLAKQQALEEGRSSSRLAIEGEKTKRDILMEGIKSRHQRGAEYERGKSHEKVAKIGADERLASSTLNADTRLKAANIMAQSKVKEIQEGGGYDDPSEIPQNVGGLPLKGVRIDPKTGKHLPEYGLSRAADQNPDWMSEPEEPSSSIGAALKGSKATSTYEVGKTYGIPDKSGKLIPHTVTSIDENGDPNFEPLKTAAGGRQRRYP